MSNTNRASDTERNAMTRGFTTGFGVDRTAIIGMSTGITRPQSVQRKLEDIARGRTVNAWAHIPEIGEACIDNNGSFHHISRPLTAMLAHWRRRCVGKLPGDMKSALLSVKKECDEAEAMALTLAFCGEIPSASALVTSIKEDSDAILALEKAKEIAEDELAAMQTRALQAFNTECDKRDAK